MWEEERKRLQQMYQETEARVRSVGQFGLDDAMQDELGELSMYDNHPADIASELFERGKDVALRDSQRLRLQTIERAQKAIEAGQYGTCQMCGQQIGRDRLTANPLATLCVDCKRQEEALHPDRQRPVEEEFLWPGYGRTDLDQTDDVVFDGEDSWQAVERYNERPEYADDYNQIPLDDNEGIVDDIDQVSNEQYRRQLP